MTFSFAPVATFGHGTWSPSEVWLDNNKFSVVVELSSLDSSCRLATGITITHSL